MKSKQTTAIGVILLFFILLATAGILWLGNSSLMPPPQTVNQVLPDDRIPH